MSIKKKENFTAGRMAEFVCEPEKAQTIYWDARTPGLGLRVTPSGAKSFVFEAWLNGKSLRITIGGIATWTIGDAQVKARAYKAQTDQGINPKEVKQAAAAAELAARIAAAEAQARESLTLGEVWAVYLEKRKPHWGDRHYQDHLDKISPGGVAATRGTRGRGHTVAGPLHYFAEMPLSKIDAEIVEEWSKVEGKLRPTSARLSWRLLKVFFQWCKEQKQYAGLVPTLNPGKTKSSRQHLGKAKPRKDNIESDQLSAWFDAVKQIPSVMISAFLQTLLLTGARPGEVLQMKWGDINWRWNSIVMRDKIEGNRTIPLTPYVKQLLSTLPRIEGNDHVFASSGKTGRIASPNALHHAACEAAGLDPITLHGLRRTFASLTAQMEIAGGVAMQIQGHKPVSSREKSYIVWPLDFLKKSHMAIEAKILELGGVTDARPATDGRVVVAR